MAKFLQDTLEETAVQKKHDGDQKSVQDFADFLQKVGAFLIFYLYM